MQSATDSGENSGLVELSSTRAAPTSLHGRAHRMNFGQNCRRAPKTDVVLCSCRLFLSQKCMFISSKPTPQRSVIFSCFLANLEDGMRFCRRSTPAEGREAAESTFGDDWSGSRWVLFITPASQAAACREGAARQIQATLPSATNYHHHQRPTRSSQLSITVSYRIVSSQLQHHSVPCIASASSLLCSRSSTSSRLVTFATAPNSRRLPFARHSTSSSLSICNRAPVCSATSSDHFARSTYRRRIETATLSFLIATARIVTRRGRCESAIVASLSSMATSNLRQ